MLRPVLLFLVLFSCSSLKQPAPSSLTVGQKLSAVQVTGEGRGRVGLKGKTYVFSYDALLNEKKDWILSAVIPMHGEELLVFPDLTSASPPSSPESFERRIAAMFKEELGSEVSGEKVLQELRSLIRFVLSEKLKIQVDCPECYQVKDQSAKKLVVERDLGADGTMSVEGENYQDQRFLRTNFYYTRQNDRIFSLELLWK